MSRPTIAVLIACHNRKATTLACLESLARQNCAAVLHPIVFDDGSMDGTRDAVRRDHPGAEILTGAGTAFWAGGMRRGFDHALGRGYDFYLWLNDDVLLAPDAITRLLEAHGTLNAAGRALCLIGGAVHDPASDQAVYGGIARRTGLNPLRFDRVMPAGVEAKPCDTLNGNVVLVPHLTARVVGSIDPAFIHTLADLDYGLRVKRARGWVGLAPGYVGTCPSNTVALRWLNPDLPLLVRWRIVGRPLGLPFRPWLHFARRHGGPMWLAFALLVYWRLFVPPMLIRAVSGRRLRAFATPGRRHARAS